MLLYHPGKQVLPLEAQVIEEKADVTKTLLPHVGPTPECLPQAAEVGEDVLALVLMKDMVDRHIHERFHLKGFSDVIQLDSHSAQQRSAFRSNIGAFRIPHPVQHVFGRQLLVVVKPEHEAAEGPSRSVGDGVKVFLREVDTGYQFPRRIEVAEQDFLDQEPCPFNVELRELLVHLTTTFVS